jgi:hypothetical protein
MSTIKYAVRCTVIAPPKTLRVRCDAHAHQVLELEIGYGYDTGRVDGKAYDVLLHPGWSMADDCCHTIIEPTVADLLRQLRAVVPCDCAGCRAELAR